MIKKFNNLFEVQPKDNFGTAILKSVAKGYIQGMVLSTVGLGLAGIAIKILDNKLESQKEVEIEEDLDENVEEVEELQMHNC